MADKSITITRQAINPEGFKNITNLGIAVASAGGGGSVAWGGIMGTLSSQSDLQNALNAKVTASANETITGDWTFSGVLKTSLEIENAGTTELFLNDTTGANSNVIRFQKNGVTNAQIAVFNTNDNMAYYVFNTGAHRWFTGAGIEKMRLTSTGNVGIGTATPIAPVHIGGFTAEQLRLDDSSATGSPYLSFYQSGTRRSFIRHLDNGGSPDQLQLWSEYGSLVVYTGTGGSPSLSFVVDSLGDGEFKNDLSVLGGIDTTSYLLNGTSIFATANTWSAQQIFNRATENIVLKGTGSGTSNTPYMRFEDNANTEMGYFGFISGANNHLSLINQTADGFLYLGTNSTIHQSIDESGNIGVGIAPTSSYKMHVQGDINLNGAFNYKISGVNLPTASRTLTAGAGLTGGGDLSVDRTFNVGAGSGISVAADSVSLNINGLAAETVPNAGWPLATYDGANKKITIGNLFGDRTINPLVRNKTIYIEFPTTADDTLVFLYTDVDITVDDVRSVVDTGSLTFNIAFGSNVSSGVSVYSASQTANNTTTGTSHNSGFADSTIPAGNFVWFSVVGSAGTVNKLWITFNATVD